MNALIGDVTGFDGGTTHLAAVRLARQGGLVRVRAYGLVPSFAPVDDAHFGRTFRDFCRAEGVRPRQTVVGLSGRTTMIRYLKVPIVPDWKLDMMMDFEIDEQTTKFAKDSYCDYRKVDIPGLRKYNVMMIGVTSRDQIEFFLESIPRIAHFNFNALGLHGAGLLAPGIGEEEIVLLVDIGAANTEIAIMRGRTLLFGRSVQYGGNNFDADIVTALNIDIAQAEKLKIEKGQVWTKATPRGDTEVRDAAILNEAITADARMLFTHIASAVQFCKEQARFYEVSINRVFTTGGASQLRGLNAFLEERFGLPVRPLDILPGLDLSGLPPARAAHFREHIHSLTTAVGLAAGALDPRGAVLDPMPERIRLRRRFMAREVHLVLASVLLAAALAMWGWYIVNAAGTVRADTVRKENLLKDARAGAAAVAVEERFYAACLSMEQALEDRVHSSTDMLRVFRVLQETLPQDIWITGFSTEDLGAAPPVRRPGGGGAAPEPAARETLQDRGTVFVTGLVHVDARGITDPHQLLDDYTAGLKAGYPQFSAFIPLKKEYDESDKTKFHFKYKVMIADQDEGHGLEKQ
ncbi:MAG: cell division FtsA domain-containing protein [Planctomycetota bacterium]